VPEPADDITTLLQRWAEGDPKAGDDAIERAYADLRHLAAHYLRQESTGNTLQPTALVHELYLRLHDGVAVPWTDRKHFFVVAAGQMRRILVDHARARHADKRGGSDLRVELRDFHAASLPRDADLLALDEALARLAQLDARAASVVELRYFGGFSESEAADLLEISIATLKRDWEFSRSWLLTQLKTKAVR
jgi:RNA polymerase sigma factor (TIGR02999 family)